MVSLEFFIDLTLLPQYGLGVDSVSNRNEFQEYFLGGKGCRCLRLTNLPPSCADCLEIQESQPPGNIRFCPGLHRDYFIFKFLFDVLLTMYFGITLVNDQLDLQLFYFIIRLLQSSTCFQQRRAHHQEVKLY